MLWSRPVPRPDWIRWLASRTNLGSTFCRDLVTDRIADELITLLQLAELARALELAEDASELRFRDFLADSGRNVLVENLRFLFDDLERGGKKMLAEFFEVDPTTISRWLKGSSEPQGPGLRSIATYFRLPVDTNLRRDPIFLSLDPVSLVAKRNWVHDRLDKLSEQDLRDLYPALRRMLDDDR
jgi:hypothetical protein